MGVQGLWKLIDRAGKPIPIETLENKILAVDVSIWLYQLVKGFQEGSRNVKNAFLLGLFHRICKLLFYRIKPIFVFDGGVPSLKRKTIIARQRNRNKANEASEKLRRQLLENLIKQQALGNILADNVKIPKLSTRKHDELYILPPLSESIQKELEDDSDSSTEENTDFKYANLHDIDIKSDEFLTLPADVRHDILTELKETRKQNSWAKVHLMPEESKDFSNFQMERLLKRRAVQVGLEQAEQEMGTKGFTLNDLETILSEQGIDLSQRIAADSSTRFIYSSSVDVKQQNQANELGGNNNADLKLLDKVDKNVISKIETEPVLVDDDVESKSIEKIAGVTENLTQSELLQIISLENKKAKMQTMKYDISKASTSKQDIVLEEREFLSTVEIDAHNYVNGHSVEHGKNQIEDNKRLKLDHGSIPRTDFYTTMLQKETPLSSNQPKKSPDRKNVCSFSKQEVKQFSDNESDIVENKNTVIEEGKCTTKKNEQINLNPSDAEETLSFVSPILQSQKDHSSLEISKIEHIESNSVGSNTSDDDDDDEFEIVEDGNQEVTDNEIVLPVLSTISDCNVSEGNNVRTPLEIVIHPEKVVEDDMFAEVFNHELRERTTKSSPADLQSVDLLPPVCKTSEKPTFETLLEYIPDKTKLDLNTESTTKSNSDKISSDNLWTMKFNLERESENILLENKREEQVAASITEQITSDAQHLLQLFGIPYIVAPMEAEAQCAYLDFSGQTNGTITDDSDIWLFGANTVYKNFFDQRKFVKQFKASDIQHFYHLKRDDLIMIAMLVGSDYTSGIHGVGPVNAIEIVAHFPPKGDASSPEDRLRSFQDAYLTSHLNVKLKSHLSSLNFTDGFPSSEVVRAYMLPMIDDSKEKFFWSEPNMASIRQFTLEKFGWDHNKTDKTMQPIFQKLNQKTTQKNMHHYFEWSFGNEEGKVSKRVSNAVDILTTGKIPVPPKMLKIDKKGKRNKNTKTESQDTREISKSPVNDTEGESSIIKSKTPAQIAREKAAKKLKEIRKKEQLKKSNNKANASTK